MKKQLLQLELADGKNIWVETNIDTPDDELANGVIRRAASDLDARAAQRLEDVTEDLAPIASTIFNKLRNIGLEEATLEFGMKFGAKAGVILTSVDSEATFKLSLKWKPPKE